MAARGNMHRSGLDSLPSTPRDRDHSEPPPGVGADGLPPHASRLESAPAVLDGVGAHPADVGGGGEGVAVPCFESETVEPQAEAALAAGNRSVNHSERLEYTGELCAVLGTLPDTPELCDVTFLVGPEGAAEPIHGVRAILAARSKVFRSMLFGEGWLEQQRRGDGDAQQIAMPENGPEAFRTMIHYAHSGVAVFEPGTVMEVLQLADYLALEELKAGCGEYIAKSINTETAAVLLQTAHTFGESALVDKCVQFIEVHTEAVVSSEAFTEAALSPDLLCKVLASDALTCSEELSLYRATVAWGRAFCEQHPGTSLAEALAEPLRHIRLPLINTAGLMSVVRADNLVSMELLLEALAYQSDPGTVDASHARFRKRTGTQLLEVTLPQWQPGYMSFLSSSGGSYYEFSASRRTATKARNDGTIQSIRACEPLEPGKVHTFAFHIDKWVGGDIDVGFGVDCGSKLVRTRIPDSCCLLPVSLRLVN